MQEQHLVKTYLVCGFLGAGKTTFILEYLKSAGANGARVAVLVNEFGQLGIDGEVIREYGGIDVVELPGGCICCSQKRGLIENIRDIAAHVKPDQLLIEPSGVAETSEMLITLADTSLKGVMVMQSVLAIVDATTFMGFSEPDAFGTFFLDQIEHADVVLVNKEDLVDKAELEAIRTRLEEINPRALIMPTAYGRIEAIPKHAARAQSNGVSHEHGPRLAVSSISIRPHGALPPSFLGELVAELSGGAFGGVLRAKGFVDIEEYGLVMIQLAGSNISIELVNRDISPRLVFIGCQLNEDYISEYFNRLPVRK